MEENTTQTRLSQQSDTNGVPPLEFGHPGQSSSKIELREHPHFSAENGDFSDMVDFYLKYDQLAHGEEPTGSEASQKKCRFCS